MIRLPRLSLLVAATATLAAGRGHAQASANVALDDPRLPLVEHLIARGVIRDPSPMIRPLRRADVVAALADADTAAGSTDAGLVRRLAAEFTDLDTEARWEIEGRAGVQAATRSRRDLLHPGGPSIVRPYADLRLEGAFGPFIAVSRPAIEPRLSADPDWRGRTDLQLVGRMAEAYVGAQFKWGRFWFGQFDQNWGPSGYFGIPVSPFAYPRTWLGLDIGSRTVRLRAQVAKLRDETDSTGAAIKRYNFMHRLSVRFSSRFEAALWAASVFSGEGRSLDGTFINPVGFLVLANQYGEGDAGNVILGTDINWRVSRATTLQLQLALDDLQYENRGGPDRYPDRWALTVSAFGPLARSLSWQALYTQASTLAFRTTDPFENYTDAGVGLGRGFADMDYLGLTVTAPIRRTWAVTPELAVQRQGAARLTDLFPATPEEAGTIPQILSDPVETTWRAALNVSGRSGPLDLQASAGLHHRRNADNVEGRNVTRFEGRLQATLALRGRGRLD